VLSFAIGGGIMSKLVDSYKKVEDTVVGGYQKIEINLLILS
jgi:hypothetical protein